MPKYTREVIDNMCRNILSGQYSLKPSSNPMVNYLADVAGYVCRDVESEFVLDDESLTQVKREMTELYELKALLLRMDAALLEETRNKLSIEHDLIKLRHAVDDYLLRLKAAVQASLLLVMFELGDNPLVNQNFVYSKTVKSLKKKGWLLEAVLLLSADMGVKHEDRTKHLNKTLDLIVKSADSPANLITFTTLTKLYARREGLFIGRGTKARRRIVEQLIQIDSFANELAARFDDTNQAYYSVIAQCRIALDELNEINGRLYYPFHYASKKWLKEARLIYKGKIRACEAELDARHEASDGLNLCRFSYARKKPQVLIKESSEIRRDEVVDSVRSKLYGAHAKAVRASLNSRVSPTDFPVTFTQEELEAILDCGSEEQRRLAALLRSVEKVFEFTSGNYRLTLNMLNSLLDRAINHEGKRTAIDGYIRAITPVRSS